MPKYTSHQSVLADLQAGKTSCVQLVRYYLTQIETHQNLNAYIEVFGEEALEKAAALDSKYKSNPESVGKLFGMVISIKDLICYKGHKVTGASKILSDFESLYSATAVERVLAEDAIIIGRTNCDQFGMGSTNENSFYGPVRNAVDDSKIAGGSSGGSAVAVQADTCLVSLGTDTGGSVRQPAALCGVMGMKPSYGRISRYGLLAYGSSFDQIGVLANSVNDIALLLEVMAGSDDFDSTASQAPVPAYSQLLNFNKKVKIAYFDTAINHEGLDPEIKSKTLAFIEQLRAAGHTVEAVDFDYLDHIIPAYYVLTTAEASSNLSRYDGIRFGYRNKEANNLEETYKLSRTEGFSKEVKRRIMLGTFVLSSGYYDAYYTKAQKVRRQIQQQTLTILEEYFCILMPVTPRTAWNLGEHQDNPVSMYLSDIYTVQANMVGIPAISIPLGEDKNGLPIGIQLMGQYLEESKLLAFANYVTQHL